MTTRILIGADIVPTRSNYRYFKEGNVDELIGKELKNRLQSADFTIFNLETPLADKENPIEKAGPNLIAPTYTIKGLKAINPCFFSLANNHILDQGEQGLSSTIQLLGKEDIKYAGAGKNLEEAKKPYIFEQNGIRTGIYCCAEHEFTIAADETPGANPFEPLESLDHIIELKGQCDFVIVLYHGGKEHYRYPSPYLQKLCRKMVEKGADIVVCQHTHCVGCEEKWNKGTIIYGQGNFLFDNSDCDFWQTGLLTEVIIEKHENNVSAAVEYYPLRKVNEKVRLADKEEGAKIIENFISRSHSIKDEKKVKEMYQKFAEEMLPNYLATFSGKRNLMIRVFNKLSGYKLYKSIIEHKYKKYEKIAVRNYIECEAHRELVIQGLRNIEIF